ncbi:hypothetical protein JCGZ_02826 [Jatropha curcas]|uniref:Uncharacterized protein n=1 Tax=Jatropha curcas TaxID=180498 RepID=A0A067JFM8_JATCU|nr:hypothetical protein JCGZ_02826 [Jatropha curcas]
MESGRDRKLVHASGTKCDISCLVLRGRRGVLHLVHMPLFYSGVELYFDADLVICRINMISSGSLHATDEEVNSYVPPNGADAGESVGEHVSAVEPAASGPVAQGQNVLLP